MKIKWYFMMMVILELHPVIIMGSVTYAPQMIPNNKGVGPEARTDAAVVLYYDPYAGIIGCTHWIRG